MGATRWSWAWLSVATLALTALNGATAGTSKPGESAPLPGTQPLRMEGDLAEQMVSGISRYLDRELAASVERRSRYWNRDLTSPEAYSRSVAPNRQRLRKYLGVVDARVPFSDLETVGTSRGSAVVAQTDRVRITQVRWPVLKGVTGEGLLLEPRGREPRANVIALPDCDWTPEMLAGVSHSSTPEMSYARTLAERGCRVLVPALLDRKDTYSGNPAIRMTNQPHREFVYRCAFEMGRHIIGYEIQKVLAGVDWFAGSAGGLGRQALGVKGEGSPTAAGSGPSAKRLPVAVVGYGEGGLIALYSAALDERIDATLVSGYFRQREKVFSEPLYRNVFGLLDEFGDAEAATLVYPRRLIVEHCRFPEVSGPPAPKPGRAAGAAPGAITTPSLAEVRAEALRVGSLLGSDRHFGIPVHDHSGGEPMQWEALRGLLTSMGLGAPEKAPPVPRVLKDGRSGFDPEARTKRQFDELVEHTQHLMREGQFRRKELWAKADGSSVEKWRESTRQYRELMWEEVIGRLPTPTMRVNARTRLVYDQPTYRGYEVVLDVYPDVFAYGILLLPKDMKPGEKRPVIVCQHGLEGRPQEVADPSVNSPYYHQFANRLTERGFITFSPQNPYIGKDQFRMLQRKLNPLKKSLFSVIVGQHERILDWLAAQPFVDGDRMAFYGLSYGGKTAMRVPALLERYAASICSGDFNEWIWKNVDITHPFTYPLTPEWEMFEFDLGNTFNYAEMAWLICPRPFMVERGRNDGVALDEWVGYEFARVDQRYHRLKIPERCEIEWFVGPHEIHGVGTYDFLHRHLRWPVPPGLNAKGAKSAKDAKGN